jgi:cytochrome c553
MELFRSGARLDSAMQIVAAHRTFSNPDDITELAGYLADLNPPSHRVEGSGQHLDLGQQLYAQFCTGCHGVDGRGDRDNRVPRLTGQHYPYLKRQIEAAANLHKDIAPPEMISALRSMRPAERDALADYLSRLGQPESLPNSNQVGGAAR